MPKMTKTSIDLIFANKITNSFEIEDDNVILAWYYIMSNTASPDTSMHYQELDDNKPFRDLQPANSESPHLLHEQCSCEEACFKGDLRNKRAYLCRFCDGLA